MTRRGLLARGAAAAAAAATLNPLRAFAQGPNASIAEQWAAYAQSLVGNPGSAVGYAKVQSGQSPTATSLGTLAQGGSVPAAADTIYELGSVTKVFTAILLALTMDTHSSIGLGTTL